MYLGLAEIPFLSVTAIVSDRIVKSTGVRLLGIESTGDQRLILRLQGEYKLFAALTGIDDDTQGKGSVSFEAYIDERLAFRTPVLHPHEIWHINVSIPRGSRKLRLAVTDGGDDYNYDWAIGCWQASARKNRKSQP